MKIDSGNFFFCPICKNLLAKETTRAILFCDYCDKNFLFENNIPLFEKNISEDSERYWEAVTQCDSSEPHLLEFFPPHERFKYVLDLGSGEGRATVVIAQRSVTVVGLDTSKNSLLRLLKRGHQNIIAVNADAKQLPFPDNFFDLVTSLSMVEHIQFKDVLHIFREVRRVLVPSGRFLVRNDAWFYGVLEKLRIRPKQFGRTPDITHVNMMTGFRFKRLLGKAGFRVVQEDHFPFYRYKKKYNIRFPLFIQRIFATHSNFICEKYEICNSR